MTEPPLQRLIALVKQHKKAFMGSLFLSSLAASFWVLSSPLYFTSYASFKDKGNSKASLPNVPAWSLLLGQAQTTDTGAVALFKSRSIMEKMIKEEGLQIEVEQKLSLPKRVAYNAMAEYAWLTQSKTPFTLLQDPILKASQVTYEEEAPLPLQLVIEDQSHYTLYEQDNQGRLIGKGLFGKMFYDPQKRFSFTLALVEKAFTPSSLTLQLHPLNHKAVELSKRLTVYNDPEERAILHLRFVHRYRRQTVACLDRLMQLYSSMRKEEGDVVTECQLHYLQCRQEKSAQTLEEKMMKFAATLSEDSEHIGFIDTQRALEFLSVQQQQIASRQLALNLQIQRLKQIVEDQEALCNHLPLLQELSQLQPLTLSWQDLRYQKEGLAQTVLSHDELTGLSTASQYDGLDLALTKELFLMYAQEKQRVEEKIMHQQFVIEKLKNSEIDLGSCASTLEDPVSKELVSKATALQLAQRDIVNRSDKEQERIAAELSKQRAFLITHLEHLQELFSLQLTAIRDNILSVQKRSYVLVQQQMKLIEKQIREGVEQQIHMSQLELRLLYEQHKELQKKMDLLPARWVMEQLIHLELERNREATKEITALVESKNISGNMEVIQSAPLDAALLPLHPNPPYLLLSILLASSASFLLTLSYFISIER